MDLFLFGTLLHVPLLQQVSGDDGVALKLSKATRQGHRVSRVAGHVFPMMHEDLNGVVDGLIVRGLDDAALARLDYYEKSFGYDRVEFTVLDATQTQRSVTGYLPEEGRWSPDGPWECAGWAAKYGAMTILAAHEAMSDMANTSAVQMGQRYPQMMARAASRQRAMLDKSTDDFGPADVDVIDARRPYSGFFTVAELDLKFKQFDGEMSGPVNRSVFVGVDCAIVLPYDPVRDRVLLVQQFRPGAYVRGDPNPWTIEPIAGRIDPGEDPEQAARREAFEEAGITLRDVHSVCAAYPSPGTTSEYFFMYVGLCDLPDDVAGLGGLASEAEDIRSHIMEWSEFDAALKSGGVNLLPLIGAGHWLARNRDAMRTVA